MSETATFCEQCGNGLGAGVRFCGTCGAAVAQTATPTAAPAETARNGAATTTVLAPAVPVVGLIAPPPLPPPGAAAVHGARNYKPLIAAGVFLVAAVAAGLIVWLAVGRGDSEASAFVADSAALIAPVSTADQQLAVVLSVTGVPASLPRVAQSARSLEEQVTRAQGAASVLDAPSDAIQAQQALADALAANLAYARQVAAAASNLTATRAASTVTAAAAARQAWQSLAAAQPGLVVPTTTALTGAGQLVVLAREQGQAQAKARAQAAAAAASATDRQWVQAIDGLLRNSAETRYDLGALIGDVRSNTIDPSAAIGRIEAIIGQRQDLQNQIASRSAPAHFQSAAELLRQSIRDSLDDDFAIQGWITGWYDGDAYTYNRFYAEHEAATSRASAAKAEFLRQYNALRSRYLKLPPISVAY